MASEPFDLDATVEQMHPSPSPPAEEPVNPLQRAYDLVREAMAAYVARDNNRTSLAILAALSHLNDMPVLGVSDEERLTLGQTLDSILDILLNNKLALCGPLLTIMPAFQRQTVPKVLNVYS